MNKAACILFALVAAMAPSLDAAPEAQIIVDAADVRNTVSPWLYGSCIEDVNHEIYGGLYDQRLYGESFEEPRTANTVAGWTAYEGQWAPSGTKVAVEAHRGAKLVRQQGAFADGSVEFDLRFRSHTAPDTNAGALLRVGNAGNGADAFDGYEVSLAADGTSLVLGKHRQNWQPLQRVPASIDTTQWQHLRVELAGGRIRVYLNKNPSAIIDYTDAEPLPVGSVGLRTWGADVEFCNFQSGTAGKMVDIAFVKSPALDISSQWNPVQTGTAKGTYALDAMLPYNGEQSQRVQFVEGNGTVGVANQGLNRWGIAVRKGSKYVGRVHLRSTLLRGAVNVSLQSSDGSKSYAATMFSEVPGTWKKFPFELTSAADDPNARFVIALDGPGTVWMDQAVLMAAPEDRFRGLPVRADIAGTMVAGKLSFLRYGGTAVNVPGYRWKKMIGDPDQRPPYKGNWHPHTSNGFGIEEFVAFCEGAGITPAFAVNVEETPQDMADMVEYLNGAETTPQGSLRAANGHPKPYGVRYIELGNEEVIWGDVAVDYDHYVERSLLLAAAMKRVDPNLVFINAAWWRGDNPHCERVFKALEGVTDYWDFHTWADDADSGRKVDRDLAEAKQLFQKWIPGSKTKVMIFEENGNLHNHQRALGHATTLNAVRRHGDFVVVDCEANGLQPWLQNDNGWDQGHVFFTPDKAWGMPPYYAQQMAATNHLPLLVGSQVTNGEKLDVTATRSEDGKTVCLHVVNLAPTPAPARMKINGLSTNNLDVRAWSLTGNLNDINTPERPMAIEPRPPMVTESGGELACTLSAFSYTIVRLRSR